MNILLINPPRSPHNAILAHAPEEARRFIHKKLIGPPLGLLTIAAAAKDHNVTVLDMKGQYDLDPATPPPEQLALAWAGKSLPDIVGLTVITSEFNASMRIAGAIKAAFPQTLIVVGGLHATLCPGDFAGKPVDVVCVGQAASTFRSIVEARQCHGSLDEIAGIYINGSDGLRFTRDQDEAQDAAGDGFIMPDRSHLAPWLSTYFVGSGNGPVTYLFTSLGCPFSCTFCSIWPQFGGQYHQREVESVIAELKTLSDYPVVRFADANTIVSTAFINNLLNRIAEEGIRKEYVMDLRADTIVANPALIEKLSKAGLKVVICGFESFRNEELAAYNKTSQARQINEAIDILHQNDIMIRGNYVIPPTYDRDDFAALAEFASSHRVSYAGYTVLTPMPGTMLFDDMRSQTVDFDYDRYNFFNCVLKTKLPIDEFHEEVARLWVIKKGTDVI